jgi:chemotaxis protein CheZ
MLTAFGISATQPKDSVLPKIGDNLVEGPIVNKEHRSDVVDDQDDVDDLLSSLGF